LNVFILEFSTAVLTEYGADVFAMFSPRSFCAIGRSIRLRELLVAGGCVTLLQVPDDFIRMEFPQLYNKRKAAKGQSAFHG
jgi:hypothetical protein